MGFRYLLPTAALVTLASLHATGAVAIGTSFSGSYICEQMATTRDILRVPARLTVEGNTAQLTRPLLNLNGGRVGIEVAHGSINRNGELRLQSRWTLLGNVARVAIAVRSGRAAAP